MSKIEIDLQNLSALETEIRLMEKRKMALQSEMEILVKEVNSLRDNTNKEIANLKSDCDVECQGRINEANKILKEVNEKLSLAEQREKDSEAIKEQIAQFEIKGNAIAEMQKSADNAMSRATEREHKATLLIEQYTNRLNEIGGVKEEVIKEEVI